MKRVVDVCRQGDDLGAVLRQAHVHLDAGQANEARDTAESVLKIAVARGDQPLEAQALLVLGHCERLVSRFRKAHDASQRAAHLFKVLGDAAGEATALSTQTWVASALGRNEDAVEAGLLCVRLSDQIPFGPHQVFAYNNLAIACFWSRRFDKATAAFEAAVALTKAPGSPMTAFQPRLNMACAESVRMVYERDLTGQLPSAQRYCELVNVAVKELETHQQPASQQGMLVTVHAMKSLFTGLAHCWTGELVQAAKDLDDAKHWADRYPTTSWLHALERWIRGELCWAGGDLEGAKRCVGEMIETASKVEHEQLACMGHLVLAPLHETSGQPELAVAQLRALRRREYQIRAESIESRDKVAKWQLDVREGERSIQMLQFTSRNLERMSYEDALTGIANRRSLEQRLGELLRHCQESSEALSVAFIDVDRFKSVNDSYSHRVGDEVLRRIAGLLVELVREHDVAARLAGDEFVVVFPRTASAHANSICDRFRDAVANFDWDVVAPSLRVTISTGVAQAQLDESVWSLLHRGDTQMYERKRTAMTLGD